MNYEDSRYGQLLKIIEEKEPKNILEIGTGGGRTAEAMLMRAPKGVQYWGFDLFDLATEETDKAEMNVKPAHTKEDVRKRLEKYNAFLFKGNTRNVLDNFARSQRPVMDVVFIDGGHSVETIESDWEKVQKMVAPKSTVVFDDYYVPEKKGFGCNKIVDKIGFEKEILPIEDYVVGGGMVRMVRVNI